MKKNFIFITFFCWHNLVYSQRIGAVNLDSTLVTIQCDLLSPQKSYVYLYPNFDTPVDSVILKFGANNIVLKFDNLDLFAITYMKNGLFFFICEKNKPLQIEYDSHIPGNENMQIQNGSFEYINWKKRKAFIDSTYTKLGFLSKEAEKKLRKQDLDKIMALHQKFIDSIYCKICADPKSFASLFSFYLFKDKFPEYKKAQSYNCLSKEMKEHRIGTILHDEIDSTVFVNINDILSVSTCMIEINEKVEKIELVNTDSICLIVHFWKYLNNYGITNTQYIDSLLNSFSNKKFIYFSVFIGDNIEEISDVLTKNKIGMRTYVIPSKYYDGLFYKYTQGSSLPHDIIFTNKKVIYQRFAGEKELVNFLKSVP